MRILTPRQKQMLDLQAKGMTARQIAFELNIADQTVRNILHRAKQSRGEVVSIGELITEEWLKTNGFKWHQFDRQPEKQWLLWLGDCLVDSSAQKRRMFASFEDLGIEVANNGKFWFCWLRSDGSHRYHRFLHVRHLVYVDELILMIEGLTGQKWDPANNLYGSMRTPADALELTAQQQRLDKRLNEESRPWTTHEQDGSRGRPLIQHVDAALEGGKAK